MLNTREDDEIGPALSSLEQKEFVESFLNASPDSATALIQALQSNPSNTREEFVTLFNNAYSSGLSLEEERLLTSLWDGPTPHTMIAVQQALATHAGLAQAANESQFTRETYEERVKKLDRENDKLAYENSQIKHDLEQAQKKIVTLETAGLRAARNTAVEGKENQAQSADQAKIAELEQKLAEMIAALEQSQRQAQIDAEQIKTLRKNIQGWEKNQEQMLGENQILQQNANEKTAKLKTQEAELASKETELASLKTANADLRSDLEESRALRDADRATLQSRLDVQEMQLAQLENALYEKRVADSLKNQMPQEDSVSDAELSDMIFIVKAVMPSLITTLGKNEEDTVAKECLAKCNEHYGDLIGHTLSRDHFDELGKNVLPYFLSDIKQRLAQAIETAQAQGQDLPALSEIQQRIEGINETDFSHQAMKTLIESSGQLMQQEKILANQFSEAEKSKIQDFWQHIASQAHKGELRVGQIQQNNVGHLTLPLHVRGSASARQFSETHSVSIQAHKKDGKVEFLFTKPANEGAQARLDKFIKEFQTAYRTDKEATATLGKKAA